MFSEALIPEHSKKIFSQVSISGQPQVNTLKQILMFACSQSFVTICRVFISQIWKSNLPIGCCSTEEELGAICVGASISHRQDACSSVLQLEVLIRELWSINWFSTSSIVVCEVSTLRKNRISTLTNVALCWMLFLYCSLLVAWTILQLTCFDK